jgi:hypothetical protein
MRAEVGGGGAIDLVNLPPLTLWLIFDARHGVKDNAWG